MKFSSVIEYVWWLAYLCVTVETQEEIDNLHENVPQVEEAFDIINKIGSGELVLYVADYNGSGIVYHRPLTELWWWLQKL